MLNNHHILNILFKDDGEDVTGLDELNGDLDELIDDKYEIEESHSDSDNISEDERMSEIVRVGGKSFITPYNVVCTECSIRWLAIHVCVIFCMWHHYCN